MRHRTIAPQVQMIAAMVTERLDPPSARGSPRACGLARRLRLAGPWFTMAAAGSLTGGCDDVPGPEAGEAPPAALVSNPVANVLGRPQAGAGAAALASAEDEAVYVSLAPDSFPGGQLAIVRNPRNGAKVIASMTNGGLDPVPVEASAGDRLELEILRFPDEILARLTREVPGARKPRVVRVYPPHQKRDVVLNAPGVIIFSEPVASGTLTQSTLRLFRRVGSLQVPVRGTVRQLAGTGAMAAFAPDGALAANATYRLVVTPSVQDQDGEALAQGASVEFSTGQALAGPAASVRVSPDTVQMTGATYQLTVMVEDAAGNILIDEPVTWSTTDPSGLTVSATGMLTALAAGSYIVRATVGPLEAMAWVVVAAGAPASLQVSPAQATVGAQGDTMLLRATVRDEAGRLLDHPSVTWTSSAPGSATVASDSSGSQGQAFATVTGVSPGSVTITATSERASGTVAVAVIPPPPAVSVTITPESAELVVQSSSQLSAAVRDANGKVLGGRAVTWASDNAAVAVVDAGGWVTGVSLGEALVTATSEGLSDTAAVAVTVLNLASVSAGGEHTCGLTATGAAYCWGSNFDGQLGNGTTNSSSFPIAVSGGITFSALSAGERHTCGLSAAGAAYCWGANWDGQLGIRSSTGRSTRPAPVAGGLTFSSVSAGRHTCALSSTGVAHCWGPNGEGQLGNGSTSNSPVPVPVFGGLKFSAISARGEAHTCGLTSAGAAYCWGLNVFGNLGNGSILSSSTPVTVVGGLSFITLGTGVTHTCALTATGAAFCWGENAAGKLGIETSTGPERCREYDYSQGDQIECSMRPVAVSGGLTFSALSVGGAYTCGLTSTGEVYCWGANGGGQLGTGSSTALECYTGAPPYQRPGPCSARPVAVTGGFTFSTVNAGLGHACALSPAAGAYCWGFNGSGYTSMGGGQLGTGSNTGPEHCPPWGTLPCSTRPVKVAGQR